MLHIDNEDVCFLLCSVGRVFFLALGAFLEDPYTREGQVERSALW